MPQNPFAGWMNAGRQQEEERVDPNSMRYYRWAGQDEWKARILGIRRDPSLTEDWYPEVNKNTQGYQSTFGQQPSVDSGVPQTTRLGGQRELTPGEKLSQTISESIPYRQATMVSNALADYLNPDPSKRSGLNDIFGTGGFVGDVRRGASDLIRSIGQSTPQTVADLGGAIADMVTGNTGRGQDYTLAGNKAAKYFDPGGVAQTVGSFVPDIATGVGAFKAATKSLTKMAAKSAAGEAGRIGAWAAAGSAEPTALKVFGRAISPAATRIERAAATAAAAVPTALNVAPEVAAGRMNAAEGALTVALGAAAGPLSAGQWGGRFLTNLAGDVAVNLAAQATTEVVPALVPGGAQFDAAQVWKNMTYGAALGTMFGVMNAKPIQGSGERVTLGGRVPTSGPDAMQSAFSDVGGAMTPPGARAVGGTKPVMVELAQAAEQRLTGQVTLPDNATTVEANERLAELRQIAPEQMATLQRTPEGGFTAFSDQYRAQPAPDAATKNVVEIERSAYANALAARYKDNPEALAQLLDLEVQPGELTPENAQQVLASKVVNEWLVQPVEGKGIAGVEQRLAEAGVAGVGQDVQSAPVAEAVAGYPVSGIPDGMPSTFESAQMAQQMAAPPLPRTAAESAQLGGSPLPRTAFESAQLSTPVLPRTAAESAQIGAPPLPRTTYEMAARLVQDAEQDIASARNVAERIGIDPVDLMAEGSIPAKIVEAEQAGLPPEEARAAVAEELATNPESFNLTTEERSAIAPEVAAEAAPEMTPEAAPETAPEAITGEPVEAEQPRVKRPRMARAVAPAEPEAQLLEALEGPPEQVESNIEYEGAATRPNSSVGAEEIAVPVNAIRINGQVLEAVRIQNDTKRLQKQQSAAKGEFVPEVGKQTYVDRKNAYEDLVRCIAQGKETVVSIPPMGKVPLWAQFLSDLEADGTTPSSIREQIAKYGRTIFEKGNIELVPVSGEKYQYTVVSKYTDKQRQAMADSLTKPVDSLVRVAANERTESRKTRRKYEDAYNDLEDAFEESRKAKDKGARYEENYQGLTVEAQSELLDSFEDGGGSTIEDAGYKVAGKYEDDGNANWRDKFPSTMRSAQRFVTKKLESLGVPTANIKPDDIKYFIVADTGPGVWRDYGKLYVENTMDPEVRKVLTENYETIAYPKGKNVGEPAGFIKQLNELAGNADDYYFTERFDSMSQRYAEGADAAQQLADILGVKNPAELFAWARWKHAKDSTETAAKEQTEKRKVKRDNSGFTEERAAEINAKYDKLVNDPSNWVSSDPTKEAEGIVAMDAAGSLIDYVKNERGAEAFKLILNENLLGGAKSYKMSLRNLKSISGIQGATLTTGLFLLDEAVENIEENETYFGIPGSVLKPLFGNGETATYALMTGGFVSGMKSNLKPGTKLGSRARAGNFMRRTADSVSKRLGMTVESYASMTPKQKSDAADEFMARKYPKVKPGTEEYNQIKATKIANEDIAAVKGFTLRRLIDPMRKDKSKGTLSWASQWVNDPNLVGAKSQFVQEYIVEPYVKAQAQVRRVLKEIEDPVNRVVAGYIQQYKKDSRFWDAFWALDYRMSDIALENANVSPAVLADLRLEQVDKIKKDYFTDGNGVVNEKKFGDFMDFQDKLNPLRKEHLRSLYAKSFGVNSWDIESHYAEQIVQRDRLNTAIGAAQEGFDRMTAEIKSADDSYNALVQQVGRERADALNPGYAEGRNQLVLAQRDYRRNLRSLKAQLQKAVNRINKIDTIDSMIEKSQSSYYMFRYRENDNKFVVRVQFDPKSGIPSTRREYDTLSEARVGQAEILRGAATKMQATSAEYIAHLAKKEKLTDRMNELDSVVERTPEQDAEYAKVMKELDRMQGYKTVADMSDAEVFRFASDFEQLGLDATIRDMRRRPTVIKGSSAAQRVLDMVMSSQQPVEAQLLTRTKDTGALIKPGATDIDYVPGKGNSALVDLGGSGQVLMAQGEDAFTIDNLIDQIDDMVDEPIDRAQLRELMEKNYTYRETSKNTRGGDVETVWVDMGAMRRLIEAYTDPYVPNLVKRNNWVGYYDPDGTWNTKQRVDYTVKSIESMLSQIQNYNNQTSLRTAIDKAENWLDKWDINNGLREYVSTLQAYNDKLFKGGAFDTLTKYEMQTRRAISFGTLATNLSSAIGNRIQGLTIATGHGLQNASTKYGIYKSNPDGTRSEVKWMPSEASARAELYKMQEKGDNTWKITEGFKSSGLFNVRSLGVAIGGITFPELTLRMLAKADGYGTKPMSEQGKWARLYDMAQAANLQQGGVAGSYTVKQGIETKTGKEQFLKYIGFVTDRVERANNFTSILLSGLDIDARLGITDADWQAMGSGQRNAAIEDALTTHRTRLEESTRARAAMDEDINALQRQLDEIKGDVNQAQERIRLEKLLQSKKERAARLATNSSVLVDSMIEYVTYNRGLEQGNWDKFSKSKMERGIESLPLGNIAMTMTAPILRSYNGWQAMWRRAGQTEGGTGAKLGRAAGPLLGAAILTTLLGGAATTVAMGGLFLADVANLFEMVYAYANGEDGEKLDKIAGRQAWEDMAADLAEKYGVDPVDARAYVRAAWPLGQSEGLIRSMFDLNVNAGAGIWDITGGGTPAQVVIGAGKNIGMVMDNIASKQGSGTAYDIMYAYTNVLPTSAKRVAQTSLQYIVPPSAGGFGLVKVDKFGQPIYDKNQQVQYLNEIDVVRNTFFGKPWSETRSKLIGYEGGTPLYTEQDRIAWANTLGSTKYVQFGVTTSAAAKGKGVAEQSNLALFERDAERLQRVITNKYKEYRPQVDNAKNQINTWYKENPDIPIGGGQTMPFRQILSIVASSGTKAEFEIKGSAPDEVRKSMLSLAEDWGRSRAAAEAVAIYYRGQVSVRPTEQLYATQTADQFAVQKLGERFGNAYGQFLNRQAGRQALGQ